MLSRARGFVAPAYLAACLVLGGSAQGIWQNALLQLLGLAIIAWAALDQADNPVSPPSRQLLILGVAALALVVLQLIPLPASIWPELGGRRQFADGFGTLGMPVPPQPLALVPAGALSALLAFIPPLALFCAMVRLKAYRPQLVALAIVAVTIVEVALGALQVAGSGSDNHPWYIYPETSFGKAVGFFANVDHMATLLIVSIPFLVAIVAYARTGSKQRYSAAITIAAGAGLVVLVGLALNGSLAGYGLALAVLPASALILISPKSPLRAWIAGLALLLVIGALVALESTSIGAGSLSDQASSSVQSRVAIFETTKRAIADFMPLGSGLGSFLSVYRLYEQPQLVDPVYVIHAHNDYAELILELGLAGVALLLAFLAWWAAAVWRVWRSAEAGPFARAAAIASAAILIHSLVDFPLRTAAIAGCFAACLALLADRRSAPPPEETGELRRKRHVEFR